MPLAHVEKAVIPVSEKGLPVLQVFLVPGAVTAGTNIALPNYARGAKRIVDAFHIQQKGGGTAHSHDIAYVKGTATTYVPDDSTLAGTSLAASATITTATTTPTESTMAAHVHSRTLTVVTTTPAAGEIQLVDENNIKLGDDTNAGELLILTLEYGWP